MQQALTEPAVVRTTREPLRVLVVSYAFPPTGGAGVQRVSKLVKYLDRHGVMPEVLTVKNPSVPLQDASLLKDVPPKVRVRRAPTLEPSYAAKRIAQDAESAHPSLRSRAKSAAIRVARELLVPDAQILWQPGAQLELARALRSEQPDVLFVSGPPFSQFLLTPTLRALSPTTAIVLDYRDEWSTYRERYETMGTLARLGGAVLEGPLLRLCDAVTTATEAFRHELLERFAFLEPEHVTAIPNGYDSDDWPAELPSPPEDRFVLTHAGTSFALTNPRGFFRALELLWQREPRLAQRIDVRFVGRAVDKLLPEFDHMAAHNVQRLPYVPHDEVLRLLSGSHLNLCILDDVPGTERIYPGKIFELMRLHRPVLTLAPPGALSELVREHRLGAVFQPSDTSAIAGYLAGELQRFDEGRFQSRAQPRDIERFERRHLAGEFAEVFREARDRRRL